MALFFHLLAFLIASSHFFSVGPAAQRQIQNGPSPDEMEAQRR